MEREIVAVRDRGAAGASGGEIGREEGQVRADPPNPLAQESQDIFRDYQWQSFRLD